MADMAALHEVEVAWGEILAKSGLKDPATAKEGESCLIPVTYMNSAAELKDFCGRHGGIVCTSSNATGILEWAYERAGPRVQSCSSPINILEETRGFRWAFH